MSLVIGDLNRDSLPDVAVANESSGNLTVLLGKGDGTLNPALAYPTGAGAISVTIGDMNNDAILDVATANFLALSTVDDVTVLLGSGNGTMQPQSFFASAGDHPTAIATSI
jgi:hypothetical protein